MSSPAELLASLPEEQKRAELEKLSPEIRAALNWDWKFWARPNQLEPEGKWAIWLFNAGRGAGKTRSGAEWTRQRIKKGDKFVHLIAPTSADARDVMVEGPSGILSVCWDMDVTDKGDRLGVPKYEPSKRRLTWANGAEARLFSAEEPDRLRGPQCYSMWCDELAAWKNLQDTWDMAMMGLRLGDDPRCMVTTTPRPLPLLKKIMKDPMTAITTGSTFDNAAYLAPQFLAAVRDKYEGTRLGRQELMAELLEDIPGALWKDEMFKRTDDPGDIIRIVVAVDPSGASGEGDEKADAIGIVVAGIRRNGTYVILEDASEKLSPHAWASKVATKFEKWQADRIVAEINYGGAMVKSVIQTVDESLPIRMVTASRGKQIRAEPIAALYEQGKVEHYGDTAALEQQMVLMTYDGYCGDGSPDRLDAAVWALTDLKSKKSSAPPPGIGVNDVTGSLVEGNVP